jgi:phosphate transport system substrate-binding protein
MQRRNEHRFWAAWAAAMVLAACLGLAPEARARDMAVLTIAGTGDSEGLLRALAAGFMRNNPDVKVEVPESIGTSGGIKAVLSGKADLARTARPLRDEEKKQGLAEFVFATVPVVFAVNPSVTGIAGLTPGEALGVFSGTINDWSKLGGAPGPIFRVCREMPETSREVLDAAIPGFAALTCKGQAVAYATPEAVKLVAEHPGTIGYFSLPSMSASGLTPLAFSGVAPTPEALAKARYPLTIAFALVYKTPLAPAQARFIEALGSPDAAALMMRFGCLPLGGKAAP